MHFLLDSEEGVLVGPERDVVDAFEELLDAVSGQRALHDAADDLRLRERSPENSRESVLSSPQIHSLPLQNSSRDLLQTPQNRAHFSRLSHLSR